MNMSLFEKIFQKNLFTLFFYSLFDIPSNEDSFKQLLQTLCKLIVRRVTHQGEFYKKNLDWGFVNKWGEVDLENIDRVCNTKLSALTFL